MAAFPHKLISAVAKRLTAILSFDVGVSNTSNRRPRLRNRSLATSSHGLDASRLFSFFLCKNEALSSSFRGTDQYVARYEICFK